MNMFLHGIEEFKIARGDTLSTGKEGSTPLINALRKAGEANNELVKMNTILEKDNVRTQEFRIESWEPTTHLEEQEKAKALDALHHSRNVRQRYNAFSVFV